MRVIDGGTTILTDEATSAALLGRPSLASLASSGAFDGLKRTIRAKPPTVSAPVFTVIAGGKE